jgi:magnesium chelatase family protein
VWRELPLSVHYGPARISGPLMDRIDVPAVSATDRIRPTRAETSAAVAAGVARAREIQKDRFVAAGLGSIATNARCSTALIEKYAEPDASGLQLLRDAAEKMRFSARGYRRVLKLARTLADLDGKATVGRVHLAEAIS